MPRRTFLLVLLLLSVLPGHGPVDAQETGEDVLLEAGSAYEFSELAVPTQVRIAGDTVRIEDTLSGRLLVARGAENAGDGLRVRIPQLPVGTFTIRTGNGTATVNVVPEAGVPVELDGTTGRPSRLPALAALLGSGALVVVALRRKKRALLILPVLAGVGALFLLQDGERNDVESWESCAANLGRSPRETELLRRNCKVRFMLGMLGEDGSGAEKTEKYMRSVVDPVCHEVVHLVGFYFSRMNPDPEIAARAMLPGCEDGMVHGVLEALSMFNDDRGFIATADETCGSYPSARMRKTCAHGIGHATLWRTNGDLEKAWELCATTTDRVEEGHTEAFARKVLPLQQTTFSSRDECHAASVMEWSDRWEFERRAGTTRTLLPELDEPMDVCDVEGFSELFYVGCYLGTNYRNRDPVEAADRCNDRAPHLISCFATIGDNLVLFAESNLGVPLTRQIAIEHSRACSLAREDAAADACAAALSYRYLLNVRDLLRGEDLCDAIADGVSAGCDYGLLVAREQLENRGLDLGPGPGTSAP